MTKLEQKLTCENQSLNDQVEELSSQKAQLNNKIKCLEEQIALLRRDKYGRKREKLPERPEEMLDWQGELDGLLQSDEDSVETETTTRKVKRRKKQNYASFLKGLRREEIVHDLPEEEKKGLICIGQDEFERLACKPAEYYVKVHVVKKYAVANYPGAGVITANVPQAAVPSSFFDESFYAMLLVKKFADHLPLYRLEGIFDRDGLPLKRQTMSKAIMKLAEVLKPLHRLLRLKILEMMRVFSDETTVKVQQKDKCKTSYFWTLVGDDPKCRELKNSSEASPPLVYYQFYPDRKHANAEELLGKNFKGKLHSDAYQAYEKLIRKNNSIVWQPCWAHARRKFFDSKTAEPVREKTVRLMDELFELERNFWAINKNSELSEEQKQIAKAEHRREKCTPLVDAIFKEVKNFRIKGHYLPDENIVKACDYLLSREQHFRNFLKYMDLRIDNNVCERSIRPLTIGRKNWLFAGSDKGGDAIATVSSLIQTCRNLQINPQEYLEDVLRRINNTADEHLDSLLPQNWKK